MKPLDAYIEDLLAAIRANDGDTAARLIHGRDAEWQLRSSEREWNLTRELAAARDEVARLKVEAGQHPADCKPLSCGKCRRDAEIAALRASLGEATAVASDLMDLYDATAKSWPFNMEGYAERLRAFLAATPSPATPPSESVEAPELIRGSCARYANLDCKTCGGEGWAHDPNPAYKGWRYCDCAVEGRQRAKTTVAPAPSEPPAHGEPARDLWPPKKGDRARRRGTTDVFTFNGNRNASGGYDVLDENGVRIGGVGQQAIDWGTFQLLGPAPTPAATTGGQSAGPRDDLDRENGTLLDANRAVGYELRAHMHNGWLYIRRWNDDEEHSDAPPKGLPPRVVAKLREFLTPATPPIDPARVREQALREAAAYLNGKADFQDGADDEQVREHGKPTKCDREIAAMLRHFARTIEEDVIIAAVPPVATETQR